MQFLQYSYSDNADVFCLQLADSSQKERHCVGKNKENNSTGARRRHRAENLLSVTRRTPAGGILYVEIKVLR